MSSDDLAQLDPRAVAGRAGLDLLMSHFACSEEPSQPLNAKQMADFREVRDLFPGIPGSLANSSGIFLGPDAHHDLVRPGVALYGANPTPGHLNLMRPVVRLEGRIVQVREVEAGETVGYGAGWTTRRTTRLAIVALGYADGFLRAASASDAKPGAEAIVAGRRCPLAGRVSMDLLAVDVTDLPQKKPRRGDLVADRLVGGGRPADGQRGDRRPGQLVAHVRPVELDQAGVGVAEVIHNRQGLLP